MSVDMPWLPSIGPCGVSASHLAPDQEKDYRTSVVVLELHIDEKLVNQVLCPSTHNRRRILSRSFETHFKRMHHVYVHDHSNLKRLKSFR